MAHILIAEDNESVREYVTRGVQSFGHSVTVTQDGGAALDAARAQKFDLLLTDIVMPVMDGIALALAVSDIAPDMPIIMMSGYANERQRAYNLDSLIADILSKPFTLGELRTTIDRALHKTTAS
jgi:two-component system, cell cycle response regulator CpdR